MTYPSMTRIWFAALFLAACNNSSVLPPGPQTVLVQTAARDGGSERFFTGEVRARHEVDLAFRVGGKIIARRVDVGSKVKAGDILAQLDGSDLQLAQIAAQAQLRAAESEAATASAERERYAGLRAQGFISQAAFDARDNIARTAAARLEQARAQASASGNQRGYGTLAADRDGIVTATPADTGQVVAAGQPVIRLARPEALEIAIAVPENRLAALKAAHTIHIRLWALPELQLQGELRELAPAADAASRTYAARIRLLQPPPDVRLGMSARVMIGGDSESSAVVAPLTAVVDLGQGPMVWVVADGKLRRQPVSIQQYRQNDVVLASGLQGGETVVIAGANRLAENQPVRPILAESVR